MPPPTTSARRRRRSRSPSPTSSKIGAPRSDLPRDRAPAQSPDHPDRLEDDPAGHLALSLSTVVEDDRNLDDPEVLSPGEIAHLDLEAVTVRFHGVEIDRLQHGPAKALEPTGGIVEWQTSYPPGVQIRGVAEHQPPDRPVDDRHLPSVVARAKHEVGILNRREKHWEMRRVVGEVGVHLEDKCEIALERPFEAGDVGRAQPELFRADRKSTRLNSS